MKTDMLLHKDVLAELTWDPQVHEKEVGVAVKDGVVTLTGTVDSYADKWAAERAVERVAEVRAVASDLSVKVPSAFKHTDTEIAHQALNALKWDIEVPDEKIKLAVTDGWVTLDGDVEWRYQSDAAARAIQNLAGLRGINNRIKVTPNSASAFDVAAKIRGTMERRADRTADHIRVDCQNGVVTLKGVVPSFSERSAAETAAWQAAGVKEVRDELVVGV